MGVRSNPLEHGRYWDATLNVVAGCEFADTSCLNCYAMLYAAGIHAANDLELYRGTTEWKQERLIWTGRFNELPPEHPRWTEPWRWRGSDNPVLGPGQPSIIWINSMADLFVRGRPIAPVHRIIETVALSPHIGLILSKYPERLVEYFSTKPAWWRKKFILLFSAGHQRWFDRRWASMRPLAKQGWVVGVSLQPLLERVELSQDYLELGRWVICGGEQPPGYREMNPLWAMSLRDQCVDAGLPLFVKQMTRGWRPPDLWFQEFPKI